MGERIKLLRKRLGVSQAALAERLGFKSSSVVVMWESGERVPRTSILPKLAKELGCSIAFLCGEEDIQAGEVENHGHI